MTLEKDFQEYLLRIIEQVDPKAALPFAYALESDDFDWLQTRSVVPEAFLDAESYFRAVQVRKLISKLPIRNSSQTRDAAFQKWLEAERACYRANRRLFPFIDGSYDPQDEALADFFRQVRKRIRQWIGHRPRLATGVVSKKSTYSCKGEHNSVLDKLCGIPELVSTSWPFVRTWRETAWGRRWPSGVELPVVRGNRWWSVPKNASTDRSIGIEPTLNVFFQLGYGSVLKHHLSRQGFLLRPSRDWLDRRSGIDSSEIHRALAQRASVDDSLATIDLSSASDTVSRAVVELFLPHEWFQALSALRSPYTLMPDGSSYRLEKFSSMGNGYTFELETLIFSAVASVFADTCGYQLTVGNDFSVFGDDIIIPSHLAKDLVKIYSFLGFIVNKEKTFTSGPFRESCGGDFFSGVDVRPIQIDKVPESPADWFSFHNKVYRLVGRFPGLSAVLADIRDEKIPSSLRALGGFGSSDSYLHGLPPVTKKRRQMWFQKILQPKYRTYPAARWDELTVGTGILYGLRLDDGVPSKEILEDTRTIWVPVPGPDGLCTS